MKNFSAVANPNCAREWCNFDRKPHSAVSVWGKLSPPSGAHGRSRNCSITVVVDSKDSPLSTSTHCVMVATWISLV